MNGCIRGIAALLLLATFSGCGGGAAGGAATGGGADGHGTLVVALALEAAPAGLATIRLRLYHPGQPVITRERPLAGARVLFSLPGLAAGTWLLVLDGRDAAGETLLCGSGTAEVAAGLRAYAHVLLIPATAACEPFELACTGGVDDDVDGLTDCADSDCQGAPCDDGDPCVSGEVCLEGGACGRGQPLSCDDGDPCNGVETCAAGVGCVAGTPLSCDDGVLCTADACVPGSGCAHDPAGCECRVDADCAAATEAGCVGVRCSPTQFVCETIPAHEGDPCDDGDPCTTGSTCQGGVCAGGSAVPDDALEENDGAATATPLVAGVTLADLALRGADEDWYTIAGCPEGTLSLQANLATTGAAGAVVWEVRDGGGSLASGTFDAALDRTVAAVREGPLYVRLRLSAGSGCNGYDLTVDFDDGACPPEDPEVCSDGVDNDGDGLADCADPDCEAQACDDGDRCTAGDVCAAGSCAGAWPEDPYEDNDTLATATPLTVGETLSGLWIRNGEADWYSFPVTNGRTYPITFVAVDRTLVDVGYFSFTLRRADGATLAGGSTYPDHELTLPWAAWLTGTVYLEVTMSPPNGCNGYSVTVTEQ
jgi:hypothetical protein